MPSLRWLNEVEQAMASQQSGAILTFNTTDRVFENGDNAKIASLKYFLASRYHARGFDVGSYALSTGFRELTPPGATRRDQSPFDVLPGTDHALHVLAAVGEILRDPDRQCLILIDYADHVAPGSGPGSAAGSAEALALAEILHAWSLDDNIRRSSNFVLLITPEGNLSSLVQHDGSFRTITIDLPDEPTRRGFIDFLTSISNRSSGAGIGSIDPELSTADLARLTGGLRLSDIESLFHQAFSAGAPISRSDVKERKKRTIAQLCHDLVELVEPSEGFEAVAGVHHAKEYFAALKPLWDRGAASIPQGILLAGVPGSGKSFIVKALAKELNCPCLVMRNLREMWVGQSERNLERVLQVAGNLAPVIIWTDEVDQNGGGQRSAGNSGDSGVSERMLGRMLEFFGSAETRGRILWVATTNRPDLLDVAIRDRFTVVIPFLHPTASERSTLLPILAQQVGRRLAPDIDCERLARLPSLALLSVRSLQEIVVWAGTLSEIENPGSVNPPITESVLEIAISEYQADLNPLEQEKIALNALKMTRFSSLLPWNGLSGYRAGEAEWPSYVDGLVDPMTGNLNHQGLRQRLRELS